MSNTTNHQHTRLSLLKSSAKNQRDNVSDVTEDEVFERMLRRLSIVNSPPPARFFETQYGEYSLELSLARTLFPTKS